MKRLLVYLKDYKKECALAPLFKMLEASFELITPLIVAAIIDIGIKNQEKNYILKMCILLIILGIVGFACAVSAQYFAAKAAVGFSAKLRQSLFEHLQGLSFTEIDNLGTATMITRMTSDINQVQTGVNMVLRLFLRSPFIVFGAMVMAFTIDAKVAVYFVIAILLLSIVVFGIMFTNIPLLKQVQQKLDELVRITRENLLGIRVIRAFSKEEEEIEGFRKCNEVLAKSQKRAGSISALMNPITYIIVNIAVARLIWVGAIQVDHGVLTQGQVIALYNYMAQILVELIKLANLIIIVNKAIASGNRITEVFEIQSSMDFNNQGIQKETKSKTIVSFQNVSLTYKDAGEETLENISFNVERGTSVGVIGGTGSGKSSLVNLIPRFYDTTKGSILLNGIDVKNYSAVSLQEKVGIVLQQAVLFKGSIEENIRWGKKDASQQDVEEAIAIAQAKDVVKVKGGLTGMIEQGGKNLSGGQRQRLAIARALVKKPEILILDDSASALDMATDAKLRKAIKKLEYHPTTFIVSQRVSAIIDADTILVMDDGKVIGRGTHSELLENCGVYQEIYNSQYQREGQV